MIRRDFATGCSLALLLTATATADTVTLGASRDNTLYFDNGGALSNGAGDYFFAGLTGGGLSRRGLLAFDVAGALPAGATIDSAELTLEMSRTNSGPQTVQLRRVLSDWGEGASDASGEEGGGAPSAPGDATWLHTFFPSDFWLSAGGDFDFTASASQSIDQIGTYTWGSTPELVADVQGWLDDPATNFGWLLLGNELAAGTAKRFNSRENSLPASGPELTIEFTPLIIFADGFESGDTSAWSGQVP